ncbi:MAG: transporter substrate-binding domain-containing protein [Lachnospiraceae bacterium]|nr:transporter substrate-binding domain-containing protein [Lachnospiraceae bacterium]
MRKKLSFVLAAAMLASCMAVPVMAEETEDSKVWVIATDTVFKPFEYTDDNGDFVGIDVDLLAAIAEDQGFEYELNSLGWDSAIAACQSGQADGMIAGASITDERKESGWMFSDGYYNATQSMTVASDSEITGFEDLDGQTVGVKTGTQGATYAESLQEEYGFEITYYEDSPTMYQAVLGGQVVACFEDTPIMAASIQDGDLALTILYDTENEGSPYGFAIFSEDSQELLDMFNAGLANIVENGTYAEIIANYLGEDAAATAEAAMSGDTEAETEVETEAAETEAVTE